MRRARTSKVEAIVLRRRNMGEADRLLTLYSREQGKIRAIAKGARKPQSRKTGHVELFMRTRFMLATGRNIDIITQAEMLESYETIRHDLVRITYAAYFGELLDKFTPDHEQNSSLYNLMTQSLSTLSVTDNYLLLARHFELRLLSLTGFQPQLFRCVANGEPIEQQDQFFDVEAGGLVCPNCGGRKGQRHARPISAAAVKVLRYLQTRSWETVGSLQLKRSLHLEIEGVLHRYLLWHLEKRVKSADFLHRLRREATIFEDNSPK